MLRNVLIIISALLVTEVQATTVQATGQALIVNGDLTSARNIAVNRAKQQAALQASAYISTQQQLEQGVLTVDNMSIETLGKVGRTKILKEQINNNILTVLINVEITANNKCSNGKPTNNYRKRVAIAAFPMIDPLQAQIGQLRNIESTLSSELVKRLANNPNLEALNAGNLILQEDTGIAATQELPRGSLSTVLQNTKQLDVQYLVSGVVRDLGMLTPSVYKEKNFFIDKYNKYDYLSSKYLRNFEVALFIHDGFTGTLLGQKNFQTIGLWGNNDRRKVGFASSAFWQLDYGKQVNVEIDNLADEISSTIRCNNFSVEITRTDESHIWFKAGSSAGVKQGDKFNVYRKSTFYNQGQFPTIELTKTDLVLTVQEVQASSAKGVVNGLTGQFNIQTGDVLISR